ncbi:hypothetical protein AAY473_025066 [Plecturocebus cupreus]
MLSQPTRRLMWSPVLTGPFLLPPEILCSSGRSAVAQSQLTANSASRFKFLSGPAAVTPNWPDKGHLSSSVLIPHSPAEPCALEEVDPSPIPGYPLYLDNNQESSESSKSLTLWSRLECSGMISTHCNILLWGAKMGVHHVYQAGLKLLTSSNPLVICPSQPPKVLGLQADERISRARASGAVPTARAKLEMTL